MSLTLTFGPGAYFNVRDYGAVGDGSNNDSAGIDSCLAAAGAAYIAAGAGITNSSVVVYFPPGVYIIDSPIEVLFRCVIFGLDCRDTSIRARAVASGGFTGSQMLRNWTDADWTGGETDHRRAPQNMSSASRSWYPRISGLEFHPQDNANLALVSWAGPQETSYLRDLQLQAGTGAGNRGTWGIDYQDTRSSVGGHITISEVVIDHVHCYGAGWERQFSFNSNNVTDGTAPQEYGSNVWMTRCSAGYASPGVYHSGLYANHIRGVMVRDCMWETAVVSGSALAVLYGVNVQGFVVSGGDWNFKDVKPRDVDYVSVNAAAGLGSNRSGATIRDVSIDTGGSTVTTYFGSGAALIRDPRRVLQPDSGTYGKATCTLTNPIAHIRLIDGGIVDVRLIDGTVGRLDTSKPTISGLTDDPHVTQLFPEPTVMASTPVFNGGGAPSTTSQLAGVVPIRADDTRFAYSGFGMTDATAVTGVAGTLLSNYVTSSGPPAAARVAFDTDADKIEVRLKVTTTSFRHRVWVDGQPHALAMATISGLTGGTQYYHLIDFGSRKPRSVVIEIQNLYIVNIGVIATSTVWRTSRPRGPNVVWIGDSYTQGQGTPTNGLFDAFPMVASRQLGWNPFISGVGGTGYLKTNGPDVTFRSRFAADITALNAVQPLDKVIFTGGYNDTASGASAMQTEAALLFAQCAAEVPLAERLVVLPFTNSNTGANYTAWILVRDGIKAAADALGIRTIDPVGASAALAWTTGTGKVGTTAGDGNADFYISSDGTHPSFDGHAYLGRRVAEAFALGYAA